MRQSAYLKNIIKELDHNTDFVNDDEINEACKLIKGVRRVFVAGAGRTGFVMRAFSNRLMHLKLTAYFVGEPTTPGIGESDLLIIGSGSGETDSLVVMAQKAKKMGASVLLITIHPNSIIGKIADYIIAVPGATPKSNLKDTCRTIQPMGNAFEQMTWLICDVIIRYLMTALNINENEMFKLHANLE